MPSPVVNPGPDITLGPNNPFSTELGQAAPALPPRNPLRGGRESQDAQAAQGRPLSARLRRQLSAQTNAMPDTNPFRTAPAADGARTQMPEPDNAPPDTAAGPNGTGGDPHLHQRPEHLHGEPPAPGEPTGAGQTAMLLETQQQMQTNMVLNMQISAFQQGMETIKHATSVAEDAARKP